MNNIIIIGTQPPCPRCKLLTEIVTVEAELLGLDAEIRHISYTCDEAEVYAQAAGLQPGTAKDVSKKVGIEINWDNDCLVSQEFEDQVRNLSPNLRRFEQLFREVAVLDNRLRYFEDVAKDVGILMTPVLLINEKIMHQGSLPRVADIENWLYELKITKR